MCSYVSIVSFPQFGTSCGKLLTTWDHMHIGTHRVSKIGCSLNLIQ